jgi:hypothetical protein
MDSTEKGSFHHATNPSGGWKYEKRNAFPAQSIPWSLWLELAAWLVPFKLPPT